LNKSGNKSTYPPLENLMLHRPPMLLLDGILEHGKNFIRTKVSINSTSPFYDHKIQGVPSWVGVEYMAQSIAALNGLAAFNNGAPINFGMLVSCRRFILHQPAFTTGETFVVEAEERAAMNEGMGSYQCSIKAHTTDSEPVASAQLGVYQDMTTT
jgi:predicted hotdog family 3-hydroxylacyl-ACP dehydratase